MGYPATRLRRLRRTPVLRDMVRETHLGPQHLIYPLFAEAGLDGRAPIGSRPGGDRLGIDALVDEAGSARDAGVPAVLLFGIPDAKDPEGTGSYDDEGIVQLAVRALKAAHPDLVVITDVCLCEYTDHGHCGLLRDGSVDNDATLELLSRAALSHARAGADIVAPSDMMDGRVQAIRSALDGAGLSEVAILSYAAKYASAYYGPVRG